MKQEILSLIKNGESEHLEFKSSFGKETIETISAFANSFGGAVLIGIDDKGEITGVHTTQESIQQWINQIKNATSPSIIPDAERFIHKGKVIIKLSVISYPIKPISFKGKYYKRVYNSNHLMNLNEIANEHLKTINLSWDFAKDLSHDINDISLDKVNLFIENSNKLRDHAIHDDPLTVLRKFELLRDTSISFGCFLLFCKHPSLISTIDAGCFESEIIIKDSLTIKNDLFSEVEICINFIRKHISKHFIISGKPARDEIWEYPLEAVREIVINMIVHRDYRASGDSTIKIFRDKIEFFNQGSLPNDIKMKDILSGKLASNPRNKQIASIFKEVGLIEKYGSGIKRVRDVMANAGATEPIFDLIADTFKVTLFPIKKISSGGVNGGVSGGVNGGVNGGVSGGVNDGVSGGVNGGVNSGVNGGVNDGINTLLEFIKINPGKKSTEIKTALNLPQRTVERWLKQLREYNQIGFQGPPKTGGYYANL